MKILYITNSIKGSGGLERVLAVKASYLADKFNYKVHILTLNDGNNEQFFKFSSNITFHDIKVSGNPVTYFIKYRRGIKNTIKKIKPDVISVCDDGLKGMLFPILIGKKIPVIYERHATLNLNFISINKIIKYCSKKLMVFSAKKFDAFIILTEGNKKDWKSVCCTVIPNPSPFSNKNTSLIENKENVVLAVGSQSYNKGYDRLFLSWEIIQKQHPHWQLKIYGKENLALKLQKEINELNLQKSIFLEKPIKKIEEIYNKASIFVLPSRSEGFGMVLIEAMSFGVPCVSFDCPHGPADIIKNGEDGFLVKNGNIHHFSKAIIELIEKKEKRIKMGANAKENIKRYAPDAIVPLWDDLFKKLTLPE